MASLAARDYSFLDGVDVSRYGEVQGAGAGAPFYVGLHLAGAGKAVEARGMFTLGAKKCEEPWRTLCLEELTKTGSAEERLETVRFLIHERENALSGKDGRAKRPKKDSGKATPAAGEDDSEAERAIGALKDLETELSLQTGSYDRASLDVRLWFYSRPMTQGLTELVSSLPEGLPAEFYGIAATRAAVFKRDYGTAWAAAKGILKAGTKDALYRPVLSDFCKAALYGSSDPAAAAEFLDSLRIGGLGTGESATPAASVTPAVSVAPYLLAFYSARLYDAAADRRIATASQSKVAGAKAKAAVAAKALRAVATEHFEIAYALAVTGTDRDTALWYILKDAASACTASAGSVASGATAFLEKTEYCASRWENPEFFSDILDEFIVARVAARDLDSIARLYRALSGSAENETLARIAYLAARSGKLGEAEKTEALRAAFEGDHASLYYRVMSAEALDFPIGDSAFLYRARKTAFQKPLDTEEAEKVLSGLIDFKLPELVYPEAQARYPGLPIKLAEILAGRLEAEGEWASGIRLMVFSFRESSEPITDADLALIYPRPWLPEVAAAAKEYGLPEYLLYAMIRSESLFSPAVHSGAGAIGLTQLMKPTASEIAWRLKAHEYDLADPATNITFGAYYLSEMIRRMDGRALPALFAYNAGITRVRAWQKGAAGLSDDLFLESLPYGETREYGRKVLAAAAVYGYLYYQKSPGQVVRELF